MSKKAILGRLLAVVSTVVATAALPAAPAHADVTLTTQWGSTSTDFDTVTLPLNGTVSNATRVQLVTSTGYAHSHGAGPVTVSLLLQPSGTTIWSNTIPTSGSMNMNVDVTFPAVAQVSGITLTSSPPQNNTYHAFQSSDSVIVTGSAVVAPQCNDGVDNDGDGAVDYPADTGCSSATDTTESPNPECSDGIDNDGDGRVDYPADRGCTDVRDTTENTDVQCNDGVDNDGDGAVDYPADGGCSSPTDTTEAPNAACSDGIDNDGDGRVDYPADPGCTDIRDTTENSEPQCMNNIDDDGDGAVDYPADYGCSSANDNSESPNPACSNGIDDDGDGLVDYQADPGCTGPRDTSEGVTCSTVTTGVTYCLGMSAGTEVQRVQVYSVAVANGTVHDVAGYVDVERFRLATGDTVNLACVVLLHDGQTEDPCAAAGGRFVERAATLVHQSAAEPVPTQGALITEAAICNAELVATVNNVGIASTPAFTIC